MTKYLHLVILIAILPSVVSCATTVGKNFSHNTKNIILGETTENEIISTYGEPFKKESGSMGDIETINYDYRYGQFTNSAIGRVLRVEFRNGVVNAYCLFSNYDEDSTDFDINLKDSVKPYSTTKKDIYNLLGEPSGKIKTPSNLLAVKFESYFREYNPKDVTDMWVYLYVQARKEGRQIVRKVKLLVIHFNANEVVTEVRHFYGDG